MGADLQLADVQYALQGLFVERKIDTYQLDLAWLDEYLDEGCAPPPLERYSWPDRQIWQSADGSSVTVTTWGGYPQPGGWWFNPRETP